MSCLYISRLILCLLLHLLLSFPGGSDGKASACNVGDPGSIPVLGRSPGEGNGNPLQYSCLKNSMEESGRLQSVGFSRHEYWSELPFPSPGDLPDPGIEPGSHAL